jgi:hypothetical protein
VSRIASIGTARVLIYKDVERPPQGNLVAQAVGADYKYQRPVAGVRHRVQEGKDTPLQ